MNLVDNYREKLESIKYVDTFSNIILRWEQWNEKAFTAPPSTPESMIRRVNGGRWQGVKEMDASEEEYFNTSDDEDEPISKDNTTPPKTATTNSSRCTTPSKPLVDYPEDDDDAMEESDQPSLNNNGTTSPPRTPKLRQASTTTTSAQTSPSSSASTSQDITSAVPTPERLAEKRRRIEEEDDDELGKLSNRSKKRNPITDGSGAAKGDSVPAAATGGRKRSTLANTNSGFPPAKKIAISLGSARATGGVTSAATNTSTLGKDAAKTAPIAVGGNDSGLEADKGEGGDVDGVRSSNNVGDSGNGNGTHTTTGSGPTDTESNSENYGDTGGGGGEPGGGMTSTCTSSNVD